MIDAILGNILAPCAALVVCVLIAAVFDRREGRVR
jgi:hypothetical protein